MQGSRDRCVLPPPPAGHRLCSQSAAPSLSLHAASPCLWLFCFLPSPTLPSLSRLLFKPLFFCDSGSPRPFLTSQSLAECEAIRSAWGWALGLGTTPGSPVRPRYHRYGCLSQPRHFAPLRGMGRK